VIRTAESSLEARFDEPQRTPTPGQFIVLYDGDRCLGGATIESTAEASPALRAAV
jgi:tRNA-specific 2-thiouridylase